MNSEGQVLDRIAGPIEENDDLSLVCEAFGKLRLSTREPFLIDRGGGQGADWCLQTFQKLAFYQVKGWSVLE